MKSLSVCSILLFLTAKTFASPAAKNDSSSVDSSKISMLTIGTSYGNTANYYGQTTAEKLPYASADISYKSKKGFWGAASALKLINTGSGISEIDLSGGYDFDISRKFSAGISYTRSIFANNSPLPQSINPNALSANLGYDLKWFNTNLYGDYVFGNTKDEFGNKLNDFFITLSGSKFISFGSLFSKQDYISIEPSVQLTGGTLLVGEQVFENENNSNSPIGAVVGKGKRKPIKKLLNPNSAEQGSWVYSSGFNFLTSNFKLPLAYNRAHYMLEASYQLSAPNSSLIQLGSEVQSYFTLGFYYTFFKD
jgi:hypothetical protein